jgi:hypothetical protein
MYDHRAPPSFEGGIMGLLLLIVVIVVVVILVRAL